MIRRVRRPLPLYELCDCGKIKAADVAEAKRLRREIAARTGNSNPVRYYSCRYGWAHWTQMLEQPEQFKETA